MGLFFLTTLLIFNLATTGVIVDTGVYANPEEELARMHPVHNSKNIKTCTIKLYDAREQDYDTEQQIEYNAYGKLEKFADFVSHPKTSVQYYYYDSNNQCTSFVNMLGKDILTKEDYTYNTNNNIGQRILTFYNPPPNDEPSIVHQEYTYDSSNILIERKTRGINDMITSRTQYVYLNHEHVATLSYDSKNKLVEEVNITCDSAFLFPKQYQSNKISICKTVEQNDSTCLIRTRYYYSSLKSNNYTVEKTISIKDSTLLCLRVISSKKEYKLSHQYTENKKISESTLFINGKLESKKVYTYDSNNTLLIKSEEFGPKNQLYSRYKYEYSFF